MNSNTINNRIRIVSCVLFFAFFILFFRLFYIQILKNKKYSNYLSKQIHKKENIKILRGNIYDRKGALLAISIFKYSYFCLPYMIKNHLDMQNLFFFVKKHFNLDKNFMQKQLEKPKKFFWLKRFYDKDINMKDIPKSIGREKEEIRFYPNKNLGMSILGYTNIDGSGMSGIEYSMNEFLQGKNIKVSLEKDAKGKVLDVEKKLNLIKEVPYDVYLTIDKNLEYLVESYLKKLLNETKAKDITCIIENVKTGEILVMASIYGENRENVLGKYKNLGISKVYEPGSTMKILFLGASLEENLYKLNDTIFCENGEFKVSNHTIREAHNKKIKNLTLEDIIVFSSNIGIAKVGEKLGKEKMYSYLKKFGFGCQTGIDLPGEEKGLLNNFLKWDSLSIYTIPFGQGIGVTPIQLISTISSIGNKGIMLEPRIIKMLRKKDIKDEIETRFVRRVFSSDVAEKILFTMEQVVERGTARGLKINGYRIGAKTGTAQKIDPITKTYSNENYISSMISIFPIDRPKFSILLVVDSPVGKYYGGEVCSKTMKQIIKDLIFYYGIKKST